MMPFLPGVREEDVGKGWRDDGEEAVLVERPGSVLARAAAAEVLLGDEDLCALVLRLVEHEVRPLLDDVRRLGVVAPVEEEELAVAGALDALEELLRDDLVGVDVRQRQRHGGGGEDVDGSISVRLLPSASTCGCR